MAVFQHLQEQVEHVGVGFLYLVEEYYRVGLAAHGFGELVAFFVSHVTGGGANELGDVEALAKLAHVDADERVLIFKNFSSQNFGHFGLAHPRRTHENERANGRL